METEQFSFTLPDRGSIEPPGFTARVPSGRVSRFNGKPGALKRWDRNIKRNKEALKCAECLAMLGYGFKSSAKRLGLSHGRAARFWRENGFKGDRRASQRKAWIDAFNSGKKRQALSKKWKSHDRRVDKVISETIEFYKTGKSLADRIKQKRREKEFKKYHSNVQHMLKARLRRRLRKLINESKTGRKSESFVGCSLAFLVGHVQSQFKDGMDWSNYGRWHLDHIRPCSSFDLTNESQVLECFHYSNLQPLWAADNMAKGDRWNGNVTDS